MNRILFCKVREVKTPSRANEGDAGLDFYIPTNLSVEDLKKCNPNLNLRNISFSSKAGYIETMTIYPQERLLIPSGIRVLITPKESMLMAANKSGISTKYGLIFSAEIVDSPYVGEVHIGIIKTGNKPVTLTRNQKVVQFIHVPIFNTTPEEIDLGTYEDLAKDWGTRGSQGFGSKDNE